MSVPIDALIQKMPPELRFESPVYVTRPNLPTLEEYASCLAPAWERHWLTNDGCLHEALERQLAEYLGTPYLRLFCNGTIALLTALQALELEPGNVITTPFSFPATVNVLHWHRLRPVFCDIEPESHNLDPAHLQALIGPDTRAILPVHVYGRPCKVEAIQDIAGQHGLPVVYDAAHAIGVRYKGKSLLCQGDMSMVSFHATKLFTTAEGGALIMNSETLYDRIRLLKNFGIADEDTVIAPGINGKMNELQAALGLARINTVNDEIQQRRRIARLYHDGLGKTPGIALPPLHIPDVESNFAYFPVRVEARMFGMDRNTLCSILRYFNVFARKYFYPLCSSYAWCRVAKGALPVAESAAENALCLPIFGKLPFAWVQQICAIINEAGSIVRSGCNNSHA